MAEQAREHDDGNGNGTEEEKTSPGGLLPIHWDLDRDKREGQLMAEVSKLRGEMVRVRSVTTRIATEQMTQRLTLDKHSASLDRIENEGKNRDRKLYKMLTDATRKGAAQGAVGTGGVLVIFELVLELLKHWPQ